MDALIDWIQSTPIHEAMLDIPWAFPACETLHFMGLTLLIGAILVVDLRALGLLRMIDFKTAHKLIGVAIFGFAINLTTGTLFCFADPGRYFVNVGFQSKMVLIVIAGLNAVAFELLVYRRVRAGDAAAETSIAARTTAALSVVLWFSVLILGRFMPYVEY
jgi:hypothetical protein